MAIACEFAGTVAALARNAMVFIILIILALGQQHTQWTRKMAKMFEVVPTVMLPYFRWVVANDS